MKLFDAHFHIIDPQYPLIENQGYLPKPYLVSDYQRDTQDLDIQGGAVVAGSFQGLDRKGVLSALKKLGQGYVGVIQLALETSDEDILALHKEGIRAVRFTLKRSLSVDFKQLVYFAQRIDALVQWPVELYIDSSQLGPIFPLLKQCPLLCIDHLGLQQEGFDDVLRLASLGHRVKASGFMRVNFEVLPALQALYQCNPEALMFGTDLPGTRASRPFARSDLVLLQEHFDKASLERILYANAQEFYSCRLGLGPTGREAYL